MLFCCQNVAKFTHQNEGAFITTLNKELLKIWRGEVTFRRKGFKIENQKL
jgi:hypothetical protein